MNFILLSLPLVIFVVLLSYLFYLQRKKRSFNQRVLISLVLGIALGLVLQFTTAGPHSAVVKLSNQGFHFVGSAYLSLLKMLVIPLILTSIMHAVLNLGSLSGGVLRRLAVRSVGMLLGMTALSAGIGIGIATLFHVGQSLQLPSGTFIPPHHDTSIINTLLGMIPSNPVAVMTNENTVALLIFALLFGVAALVLYQNNQEQAQPFKKFVSSAFLISKKLANLVISLTPYGVLALMAQVTSTQGLPALLGIMNYLAAICVAMIAVLLMHTIILMAQKKNPFTYYKNAYPALLVAFTTRSSFGTLPVTEETLRNHFRLSQVNSTFTPSMGATLGMNACAGVFPAILVVMAMTITHQPITTIIVLKVMFINAIASLGLSGIPGTAYVAAAVTLSTLNLPYAIIGLVQGVDPLVDMGRTATNVNGVITTAVTVERSLQNAAVPANDK